MDEEKIGGKILKRLQETVDGFLTVKKLIEIGIVATFAKEI